MAFQSESDGLHGKGPRTIYQEIQLICVMIPATRLPCDTNDIVWSRTHGCGKEVRIDSCNIQRAKQFACSTLYIMFNSSSKLEHQTTIHRLHCNDGKQLSPREAHRLSKPTAAEIVCSEKCCIHIQCPCHLCCSCEYIGERLPKCCSQLWVGYWSQQLSQHCYLLAKAGTSQKARNLHSKDLGLVGKHK